MSFFFFFFNDTATTEIYTLSLHDALPISIEELQSLDELLGGQIEQHEARHPAGDDAREDRQGDRKSTRLNSSHSQISYAVFCLKKKKSPSATIRRVESAPTHHVSSSDSSS